MDFLDPQKKKLRGIKLFAGYILVAIAIAMGSLILLFRTYGYDLDRKTGQIIQNGLIFFSAHPESSTIYLNGVNKGSTDARLTVPAGQYNVALKRDGYRVWEKTISLEGGSIERLVYPLLVPMKLTAIDQQLYGSSPAFASDSPDRHWLLVQQPGTLDKFDVFDMNNSKQNATSFSLPTDLLTPAEGDQSIRLIEWSSDNRRLLVQHTFDKGTEFIIIDRESPAESVNINKTLNINPTRISLRDKHYDQLYLYDQTAKTLQKAELKTKLITPFLNQVINYKSYGANIVMYVTDAGAKAGKVDLNVRDGSTNYMLRALAANTDYLLELTQFDGNWYLAGGAKSEGRIYIYKNPQDLAKNLNNPAILPISVLKMDQPNYVSISLNSRFISAQNGSSFAVYDGDADKRYYYTLDKPVGSEQKAEWMDGHRLTLNFNNQSVIFDFDGLNEQPLVATEASFKSYFNGDYTGLYNIAPSVTVPSRSAVTRTDLKAKP